MSPISIVGPWGNDWMFMEPEAFEMQYPEWFAEFELALATTGYEMHSETEDKGEEPYWYNFIV